MMPVDQRFTRIAKAVFATALPWQGISEQRSASTDSAPEDPVLPASIDPHPLSVDASRGQEIRRPLPVKDATRWFVQELQSREIVGERTWRALWDCYTWFCHEAELVPLPVGMKSRFAHELSKLCQRGQIRVHEGGKLRRLTTYDVPNAQPAYLRAAA